MKIIRVFPRRTNATPIDDDVRIGYPSLFDEADWIEISVTFTWDIPFAEKLAGLWSQIAPTIMSGPAFGIRSEEFIPGQFLKIGNTITSRGCPNRCWFCDVWRKEGNIRELEIKDGWKVQDDNLLACSEDHIRAVFEMLRRQSNPIEFVGGLEAVRLSDWHVNLLAKLKLKQVFFSYDNEDDCDSLYTASCKLKDAGIIRKESHQARCYVLIGYPNDTIEKAENRLRFVVGLGFMPMAMLWRDKDGKYDLEWRRFQREWANPIILGSKINKLNA